MKVLAALLVAPCCFFGLQSSALAAWSEVQAVNNFTSAASASISVPVTALGSGHLVVGSVAWNTDTTAQLTGCSDGTNTYTILDRVNSGGGGFSSATFYNLSVTSGPTSITCNFSPNAGNLFISAEELNQSSAGLAGHGARQAAMTNATDGDTTGTIVTATSGDLLWGATYDSSLTGVTITRGTGFGAGTNRAFLST